MCVLLCVCVFVLILCVIFSECACVSVRVFVLILCLCLCVSVCVCDCVRCRVFCVCMPFCLCDSLCFSSSSPTVCPANQFQNTTGQSFCYNCNPRLSFYCPPNSTFANYQPWFVLCALTRTHTHAHTCTHIIHSHERTITAFSHMRAHTHVHTMHTFIHTHSPPGYYCPGMCG